MARRPWMPVGPGDALRLTKKTLRVTSVEQRIERRGDVIEHVTEIYIARPRSRRSVVPAANVVRMPVSDGSVVAEFIRYHVLVRVFDGDPDAWLAHLRASGDPAGDSRFVRWVRSRLRQDPSLIVSIRAMVDATPFWCAAEA
ncbi:MAG TPA: hypothetical protein VNI54_05255 [Thermoanaerobaculia bacterium]|nr:hypothetical protein [Thermoanaerobaculia bacterium]